jgi:hypothetical protein
MKLRLFKAHQGIIRLGKRGNIMALQWKTWIDNYFDADKRKKVVLAAWAGEYRLSVVFWLLWFVPFIVLTLCLMAFFLFVNFGQMHSSMAAHAAAVVPLWQKVVAFPFNFMVFLWSGVCFVMAYRVRMKCSNQLMGFFALMVLGLVCIEYGMGLI